MFESPTILASLFIRQIRKIANIIDGSDRNTVGLIEKLDVDGFLAKGDACGKTGISIAMELAKRKGWMIEPLHYANSGDTAGPKTEVVGYAALAILEG